MDDTEAFGHPPGHFLFEEYMVRRACTTLFQVSIVSFPGLMGTKHSHSGYLLSELLQNILHGADVEEHLEATTNREYDGVRRYRHTFV